MQREWFARSRPLRTALVRQQVFFPDRRLIQFDCGKLQASAPQLACCTSDILACHPRALLRQDPHCESGAAVVLLSSARPIFWTCA